jgi:hypothetical protein
VTCGHGGDQRGQADGQRGPVVATQAARRRPRVSGPPSTGEPATATTSVLSERGWPSSERGWVGGGDWHPLLRARVWAPSNSDCGQAVLLHERGRGCASVVGNGGQRRAGVVGGGVPARCAMAYGGYEE